jgi:Homeodomain-like domain
VQQIERLVIRYRADGPIGLISRHRHRTSNHALKAPLVERIVALLREHYPDFGPTLAAEKLSTQHGITIAKETVRQLQIAAGFWIPRTLRPPKIQQPRNRRACLGELIQIDGCEHVYWSWSRLHTVWSRAIRTQHRWCLCEYAGSEGPRERRDLNAEDLQQAVTVIHAKPRVERRARR